MDTSHELLREHLCALMLTMACIGTPLMSAMSDTAHAAVTGMVTAWGTNWAGQTNVLDGLRNTMAIGAGKGTRRRSAAATASAAFSVP